ILGLEEKIPVEPIKTGEKLMLSIGTATTLGSVTSITKKKAQIKLLRKVCADVGTPLAISRLINKRWRLVGYGVLLSIK
ncbi:MAG: translation initiation factor IF-2 subunit gamma, partial [Promethearchaeota archaeon]